MRFFLILFPSIIFSSINARISLPEDAAASPVLLNFNQDNNNIPFQRLVFKCYLLYSCTMCILAIILVLWLCSTVNSVDRFKNSSTLDFKTSDLQLGNLFIALY